MTAQDRRAPLTFVRHHMSNMEARVVSGLVMALVALALTWQGGAAFRLLSVVIGAAVFYEWEAITRVRQTGRSRLLGWLFAVPVLLLLLVGISSGILLVLVAAGFVVLAISTRERCGAWPAAGFVYAMFPAIALAAIRGNAESGLAAMLFVFAVVWATDIFAYFAGRAFGGPKLAPRISPNKTWSGAIGGTLAGVVAGTLVACIAERGFSAHIPLVAVALSVVAQIGDLAESWVKRVFGVKDSSHVIPGHGGVMDRVDGLVAAASLMYVVVAAISGPGTGAAVLAAI